jgi:hypothetical protein
MIRVYSHANIMLAYNMKNLLEREGIKCEVRNDLATSTAGEVPPIEVWPEVLVDEADQERAEAIVDKALTGDLKATSWLCAQCSETNAPAFEVCWNCGGDAEH